MSVLCSSIFAADSTVDAVLARMLEHCMSSEP